MNLKERRLFLIDSLGALLTAFLLGVVLVNFEITFGMPRKQLYYLAVIAIFFAVYSFICFFKVKENWKTYMKIIGIANMLYCCLTMSLVLFFYQKLTNLGVWYFVIEIIIITTLAIIELKTAFKRVKSN